MAIPYGKQNITDQDIQAVNTALRSDFLTQGPLIAEFEKKFATYTGAKYAVAVSNGTAALHLAAMTMDLQPGDNVITTPITFAASANCIKYCEGNVWFADIDPTTYLLDIQAVEKLIGSKPKGFFKGIVTVDFCGRAANLQALRRLADQHGLWIIEDACHSPGGYFTDDTGSQQSCGNGVFAHLAVFSFHPVKHIATGEGGMITTNDEKLYHLLMKFRTHGITKNAAEFTNPISIANGTDPVSAGNTSWPGWYMEMQALGYNYRLTDFQAALGISQLARADEGLAKRRAIAKKYADAFAGKSWILGQSGSVEGHAYHLYVIETPDRLGLYNFLREKEIFAQVHYVPTHLMPYYQELGSRKGDFPNAEKYYDHCLSLPMFPTLTDDEQAYVIETIQDFFAQH